MPRKADGEKIDELEKIISTLIERVDNVRQEKVDKERFAVIEERLNEFKKTIEEASRRRSLFWPTIVGVLIGSVLSFLGNILLSRLTK